MRANGVRDENLALRQAQGEVFERPASGPHPELVEGRGPRAEPEHHSVLPLRARHCWTSRCLRPLGPGSR
ncbi:hypothetical protein SGCZBJ_09230 [Caulobacter zeae]|uniref:Uncharacterized protein n=1 Tax=Caulobacter zeae TaxID=2055137 RepID=A0A2N5DKB7_9CAUL|nr:hypothetical protein SGCZBJ_09230 [Caulobacter zeae]